MLIVGVPKAEPIPPIGEPNVEVQARAVDSGGQHFHFLTPVCRRLYYCTLPVSMPSVEYKLKPLLERDGSPEIYIVEGDDLC